MFGGDSTTGDPPWMGEPESPSLGAPLLRSGVALLQMVVAEGACVRVRAHRVEVNAVPALLFGHVSELLQEQLTQHPWYAEPLRIAADRARKYLDSEDLHVQSALKCELRLVDDGECELTIEGIPAALSVAEEVKADTEAEKNAEIGGLAATADGSGGTESEDGTCATFTNKVNLLDFFEDVQDIYRSFMTNSVLVDKFAGRAATK